MNRRFRHARPGVHRGRGARRGDAAPAADPSKVYRIAFPVAETGFDPARVSDLYSNTVNEAIFERLLTYDYLARPGEARADGRRGDARGHRRTAASTRSGCARASTSRRRPGVQGREARARREGLRVLVQALRRPEEPLAHTCSWSRARSRGSTRWSSRRRRRASSTTTRKLPRPRGRSTATRCASGSTAPDYNFPLHRSRMRRSARRRARWSSTTASDIGAHPVGTGPVRAGRVEARLAHRARGAIPTIRGFTWDFAAAERRRGTQTLVKAMSGKTMPQIGRVEISIIEEYQSRWLAFRNKEIDCLNLPGDVPSAGVRRRRQAAARAGRTRACAVYATIDPEITYTYFNFRDPVVGGFTPEKIALRRAIIMAYNIDEEIERHAQGARRSRREMPIPPGVRRPRPERTARINQLRPGARQQAARLLRLRDAAATAGATLPDGKPLVFALRDAAPSQIDRAHNELWKKTHGRDRHPHGVRGRASSPTTCKAVEGLPAHDVAARRGAPTIPDGENFMQLLYGPNSRPEQQRLLRVEGVRRALREGRARCRRTRRSATACSSR